MWIVVNDKKRDEVSRSHCWASKRGFRPSSFFFPLPLRGRGTKGDRVTKPILTGYYYYIDRVFLLW